MNESPGRLVGIGFALGAMAGAIGALAMWVLLSLNETDLAIMKVIAPALILGCGLALATVNLGRYQAVLLQNLDPSRYAGPPEDPPERSLEEIYADPRTEREFEEQYAGSFEDVPAPAVPEDDGTELVIEIAQCALQQVFWHYSGENPTREAFTKREQVSQPIWNSGRDVLKTIGLVSETNVWADVDRVTAMAALSKVKCEEGKIWVPILGKRGHFRRISVRAQLVDNRHTVGPPHSLGG